MCFLPIIAGAIPIPHANVVHVAHPLTLQYSLAWFIAVLRMRLTNGDPFCVYNRDLHPRRET